MIKKSKFRIVGTLVFIVFTALTGFVDAQNKKPNILVIWGDDIGTWNISHNNRGMMGAPPPTSTGLQMKEFLYRLLCTAELYCRTRCIYQWLGAGALRNDKSRFAGRKRGLAENRCNNGNCFKKRWLCNRAVW